jgi:ATP-dependent Zn protease
MRARGASRERAQVDLEVRRGRFHAPGHEDLGVELRNDADLFLAHAHDRAAALVKEAKATGKTIRQLLLEKNLLPKKKIDEVLDLKKMTGKS